MSDAEVNRYFTEMYGNGMSRMRNFQRQLVADGLHLGAYPFSKILDVDHASDIRKAEAFLIGKDN